MLKNNYITLTANEAKSLNRFNCPLEFRAKVKDANWWPLLAIAVLNQPERFEYRGKVEEVERCKQANPFYFVTTEKTKAYLYELRNKRMKRLQEAAERRSEFYEKWMQGHSEVVKKWEASISHKMLMVPFTYEDRHLLKGKWIRQRDIKFETMILSICSDGVRILNRNGEYAFISFDGLAREWEFTDGTLCGKPASVDTANDNKDLSSIHVFQIK